MDGHTLGLRLINCHHVFSSAEIKGHKILLNINVLLPCEPPTFKDFTGQMSACWVLVARSMATEECSCNIPAKIWEWPPLAFRSVLWKGKCHFHFRKAAGFGWVFMTTTTTTKNKSVQLFKIKEKEQLLAAHKLPTISQTCSSISSWSPLAPPAFALPLSTANKPAPGICQEPLSLEKLGLGTSSPKIQSMLQTNHWCNGTEDRVGMADGRARSRL